eukprot:CAMPEP_0168706210 /NCGR_PEP_ID=MMETSP0503-20121227/40475_1 /TAXON_ID=89963 /ORGANISM="Heterocapsa rotundata, Strain SCCAP K-0483" /LENGTH=176 /DNA_ID=CAMNT_0008752445 /DNA_START=10 /DNA_END=537 /DNA_ORIENTATION=-
MKGLSEFYEVTNTGHQTKLKEGDVMNLIKVLNHIKDMYDNEDRLILQQDQIFETLHHLEREGMPGDKQLKQLKKIGANLKQLKDDVVTKEQEIMPMHQKEMDNYRVVIQEFEDQLKMFLAGLKREAYYYYKSEERYEELLHIATSFHYPETLNPSLKLMQAIAEDTGIMQSLWDFE